MVASNQKVLSDNKVDPRAYYNEASKNACYNGHEEIVKLLLEWTDNQGNHIDFSVDGNQCIQHAAKNGHINIVKLLLGLDYMPYWFDEVDELCSIILKKNYFEIVKLLMVDCEAVLENIDVEYAIQHGQLDFIELNKKNDTRHWRW